MAKQPAGNRRRIFNLLKPYTPPPTGWDRVYDFIVTRARIVLLAVELIVIVSFVGKVVVDTQAKGLEDEIKLLDSQLQATQQNLEPALRLLQDKAEAYRLLWNNSNAYTPIFRELNGTLSSIGNTLVIGFENEKVTVSGQNSLNVLSSIEDILKRSASFTGTVVGRLDAGGTQQQGDYILNTNITKLKGRNQL